MRLHICTFGFAWLYSASLVAAMPVLFPDNGHYYEHVSTPRNWIDARDEAETRIFAGLLGHLATVTSAAENDFLRDTFGERAWLGANDFDIEGTWVWAVGPEAGTVFWTGGATGGPVGGAYHNFALGEPNDQGAGEDALHTWSNTDGGGSSPGEWNDTPWQDTPGYYVEYSIPEPGTLYVLLILSMSLLQRSMRAT